MYNFLLLIISFALLLWSANHLVDGATGLAHYYKLPPLLIGFTLIALGTSIPEILIAIRAASEGLHNVTMGNTVGSNIANIGLILGIISLTRPLKVQSTCLRREVPLLFLIMLFIYSLMLDGYLGVVDSCLSILVCLLLTTWLLYQSRPSPIQYQIVNEFRQAVLLGRPARSYTISLVIGLIMLPVSSKYFVGSSAGLVQYFDPGKFVTGLTLVAIGNSFPELVTSIIAIRKGADDLAIGTILGSNLFNILAVMVFPGLIHQAHVSHALLWHDIPMILLATLIFLWFGISHKKKITRWHGGLLILVYCCYMLSLLINAA